MFTSASRSYESAAKAATSGREVEANALFKAARLLEACRTNWDAPDRGERLNEALRFNQRLWTVFQSDVGRPDNELPTDLKVNLLRLSAFVDRRTFEVLADATPDKLQVLIDINRNIALGLATEG